MLDALASSENESQGFHDLGFLMVRLMELGHSLVNSKSLEPQKPEVWKEEVKGFLQKPQECSGETLWQVIQVPTNTACSMLTVLGCLSETVTGQPLFQTSCTSHGKPNP